MLFGSCNATANAGVKARLFHHYRVLITRLMVQKHNMLLICPQVLDLSTDGKEEVFYGPTLPFASNGIATSFLPAPYFTCPNLQTLQVPHHRIGAV